MSYDGPRLILYGRELGPLLAALAPMLREERLIVLEEGRRPETARLIRSVRGRNPEDPFQKAKLERAAAKRARRAEKRRRQG